MAAPDLAHSQVIRLASEIDFAGWRAAARRLRAQGVAPDKVLWTVDGEGDLFSQPAAASGVAGKPEGFTVPREFLALAEEAILHRSPERFSLLYRLLWRLGQAPSLLRMVCDPDVVKALGFAADVGRAAHRMKAFVRFRLVEEGGVPPAVPAAHVAWFEPAHRVVERTAPFFVRRYAATRFAILTPDACAYWDGRDLQLTPGVDPADAPSQETMAGYWRAYYGATFNAARPKLAAMVRTGASKAGPGGDGRNPAEGGFISDQIVDQIKAAESRTLTMAAQAPSEPARRIVRAAQRANRDAPFDGVMSATLEEVAAGVQACRRCPLWRDAIQGVSGEGPARARLMLVGEQPGDQEDLAGRPFVGPAGQVLDKALAAAGVSRDQVYVTNAVKHFKHELRGKRRLHKTPSSSEVVACRWWLDDERRIVRPHVIVALGATATHAVFGQALPISKHRGEAMALADQAKGLVTYHPSYLLRLPDPAAKAQAFDLFVEDLRLGRSLAG